MKKRFYLGFAIFIVLLGIAGVLLLIQRERAELKQLEKRGAEADKLLKDSQKLQGTPRQTAAPTTPTQPDKTDKNGGHTHDDGTFHEGAPENPIETEPSQASQTSRDFTPAQVKIPEGITDPDVKAAWERVEYIANNIWEWGGVPSQRTEELIAQLMPPPDGFSGPTGHSDAEETINLLGWLDTNDPRSAEVLAIYLCEGIIGGLGPQDMLVDVGVPAVPYLIPYLMEDSITISRAIRPLGLIAQNHRGDLEGIVDHIIIPRLAVIAAIGDPPGKMYSARESAQEALARLK